MLLFDDLFVCIYEGTNTAELRALLIDLIFELDDKANIVKCTKKKTFKKKKKKQRMKK